MKPETMRASPDRDPLGDERPPGELGEDGEIRTALDRAISRSSQAVAWLVFAAMAITVYEVVMRYGFNDPTFWAHETTIFLIAVIFALGGPVALARNKHIRVRILYDAVSPRARRWLDLVNEVLTLIFAVGMTYAAWLMFYTASHNPTGAWQLERSGTSWNPVFPALTKGIILVALVLIAIQTVLHLVQTLRGGPRKGGR